MEIIENDTPKEKDPVLWAIAKKRYEFKKSFASYIIIIAFLWAIWYFTGGHFNDPEDRFPWPLWAMLGWGIGIAFQFVSAYMTPKSGSIEREYERLNSRRKE